MSAHRTPPTGPRRQAHADHLPPSSPHHTQVDHGSCELAVFCVLIHLLWFCTSKLFAADAVTGL